MPKRAQTQILIIGSLFFALCLSEGVLRIYEKTGRKLSQPLATYFSEAFFFHHWKEGDRLYPNEGRFDQVVGWRAGPSEAFDDHTYNKQGYRSHFDYEKTKTRPRILLVGDSFIQGVGIKDHQTISVQLAEMMGNQYEVMNFGVEGHGVDQMVTFATEIAPEYQPDYVIIGFIADDLRRSCVEYAWGQAKKANFVGGVAGVKLTGLPVPSPTETASLNQSTWKQVTNRLKTYLALSRAANLFASPVLNLKTKKCITDLNAGILAYAKEKLEGKTKLLIAHLDGELDPRFVSNLNQLGVSLISVPDLAPAAAEKLGVKIGRSDDYHPDAGFARAIAAVYYDQMQRAGLQAMSSLPQVELDTFSNQSPVP